MRLARGYVAGLLIQLGVLHHDTRDADVRNDAGETALFTRQLEYVIAETYRVEYPELRAKDFIPVNSRVPSGATSFVWRLWDWAGMAKIIAHHADDLPTVEIMGVEKAQIIQSVGVGYTYSIQDVRSAQMAGVQLETEKADAARRAHENKIETLAAFGDADAGLPGFLNNANIPLMTAPVDLNGAWLNPATDPLDILDDLHKIANAVYLTTKGTHAPDTLLLAPSFYAKLATRRISDYDSTTILRAFLDSSPYIKSVDQWIQLETADVAGTGPRVMAYSRNPRVVDLVIPQPFEQLPPQAQNLGFKVPCHSRIGGVCWRYPLSAVYADGLS